MEEKYKTTTTTNHIGSGDPTHDLVLTGQALYLQRHLSMSLSLLHISNQLLNRQIVCHMVAVASTHQMLPVLQRCC